MSSYCPLPTEQTVVIMQGGGALGAYQAGVLEGLLPALPARSRQVDWVVGTSIGAINAALVAGNRPEHRIERLSTFWQRMSQTPSTGLNTTDWVANVSTWASFWQKFMLGSQANVTPNSASPHKKQTPLANQSPSIDEEQQAHRQAISVMTQGLPGFFQPGKHFLSHWAALSPWMPDPDLPPNEVGIYDTSPLKQSLLELVDFDYLNASPCRLSVSAVNIRTGQLTWFDSQNSRIGPEHIMASGALPPGFPPVEVDGQLYWDGGIYSNSPLEFVLNDPKQHNSLCFMVDLWDAQENAPSNLSQTLRRTKDIQFASRSREQLAHFQQIQDLRRSIAKLSAALPAEQAAQEHWTPILQQGCAYSTDIIHLSMPTLPSDTQYKDIDFRRETVQTRWNLGLSTVKKALQAQSWRSENDDPFGMRVFEF